MGITDGTKRTMVIHDDSALLEDFSRHQVKSDFLEDEFCSGMQRYRDAWKAYAQDQNGATAFQLFECLNFLSALFTCFQKASFKEAHGLGQMLLSQQFKPSDIQESADRGKINAMRKAEELVSRMDQAAYLGHAEEDRPTEPELPN